jgi:hypothetical protein
MCPFDRRAHSSSDMLTPGKEAHGGRTSGVHRGLDSPVSDTGDPGCLGGGWWDWDGVEGAVVVEASVKTAVEERPCAFLPAWLSLIRRATTI